MYIQYCVSQGRPLFMSMKEYRVVVIDHTTKEIPNKITKLNSQYVVGGGVSEAGACPSNQNML